MTMPEKEPRPLSGRQLLALRGRARTPPFAFTAWRRGMAAGCEWLATQLREHEQDPGALQELLLERWKSGIEWGSRSDAPRSRFAGGFDAILNDVAAIVQGDRITIDRLAGSVRP